MNIDEMIAVLEACRDGKTIQCRSGGAGGSAWNTLVNSVWDFVRYEYRIKPEPSTLKGNTMGHLESDMTAFEDWWMKYHTGTVRGVCMKHCEDAWLAACKYQREVDARIAENHKYVSYGNEYGHTEIAKAIRGEK